MRDLLERDSITHIDAVYNWRPMQSKLFSQKQDFIRVFEFFSGHSTVSIKDSVSMTLEYADEDQS